MLSIKRNLEKLANWLWESILDCTCNCSAGQDAYILIYSFSPNISIFSFNQIKWKDPHQRLGSLFIWKSSHEDSLKEGKDKFTLSILHLFWIFIVCLGKMNVWVRKPLSLSLRGSSQHHLLFWKSCWTSKRSKKLNLSVSANWSIH